MVKRKNIYSKIALLLTFIITFLPFAENPVFSQIEINNIELSMGGSRIIQVDSIRKIKLMNPKVADVTALNDCEVMVNGVGVGKSELLIFTELGRHQYLVEVTEETGAFTNKVERLLGVSGITSAVDDGIVYLNGFVATEDLKDAVMKIAKNHYKRMIKNSSDIMNMVKVKEPLTAVNYRSGSTGYSAGPSIEQRIKQEPGAENVEVEQLADTIIINGCVLDQTVISRIEKIIRVYGRPGLRIKNLVKIETKVFSFQNTIRKALQMPGVRVRLFYQGGQLPVDQRLIESDKVTVVLEGKAKNEIKRIRAGEIAKAFAPNVLNHLTISEPQQVVIEAKFMEVSKSFTKKFGFSWGALQANGSGYEDSIQTGVIHYAENAGIDQRGDQVVTGAEVTESYNPFHLSNLNRLETLGVQIQADESRDSVKVLSSPRILTLSNTEASLKVGGQIPITTIGQDGNPVTEWKDYGINLEILPEVDEFGKVKAKIHTEVSDLDYSNSDNQGNPGIKSKTADTVVYVNNGDTIVISGLITNNKSRVKKGIPYLMDIPVLGRLFQSKQWINSQSELLIFLTPKVVGKRDNEVINPNLKPEMAEQMITKDSQVIQTGKRVYKMGRNDPVGVTGSNDIKADVKYLGEKSNPGDFSYIKEQGSMVNPPQFKVKPESNRIVIKADQLFDMSQKPVQNNTQKLIEKPVQTLVQKPVQTLVQRSEQKIVQKSSEKTVEKLSANEDASDGLKSRIKAYRMQVAKELKSRPQGDDDLSRQLEIRKIFKEISNNSGQGL